MSKKEPLWVVKVIEGRIRLRFSSNKQNEPDLDRFLAIKGVEEVTFNNLTKSLLIIYRKKIIFDGYVMMDGRTIRKDSTNVDVSIKRGDVVRLAEYGHYGVIYKDCDKQSKVQESSNGKLDNSDLVIHILFDKPRIESLGTLIWRYNDNHIQIFRF